MTVRCTVTVISVSSNHYFRLQLRAARVCSGSQAVILTQISLAAAKFGSCRASQNGQEQSVWQELLDSLADNINYVDGPVLSYSQIVSHLELAVIVAKSAEYCFRLAS